METTVNETGLSQTFNLSDGQFSTDDYDNSRQQYLYAGQLLRKICIPIICAVGMCGNTLSFVVYLSRHMRRLPCSVFLAALAFVDNLFLLTLMITWVDGNLADILTNELPCQCIIFITYVSSFLSVWFIVGFTCERFFSICFPFRAYTGGKSREKTVVLSLVLLACILYNFSFWTVTVRHDHSRQTCVFRHQYFDFLQTVTWIDTVITFIIPFLTITIVNAKVLQATIKNSKRTPIYRAKLRRMRTDTTRRYPISLCSLWKSHPSLRITSVLLFVSTTFVVLNLPSHTIRLHNLIRYTSNGGNDFTTSVKYLFIQELGNMLFYTTFGCNFILYTLFGRKFRHSLKSMLMCRSYLDIERRRILRLLQSTQGRGATSSINSSSAYSKHGSVFRHHGARRTCTNNSV